MTQLLTYSRQDCFKTCRKKHWWSYEMRIRPIYDARALRMGSVWHHALELLVTALEVAVAYIRGTYRYCPEQFDETDWNYECETMVRLVCGYAWRWENDGLDYIATEKGFELGLENPATGKPTTVFRLAGKIDGIVKLEDGRLAVMEHKTIGESIDSDAPLWRRLRIDHQISFYVNAARRLGYDVATVLYDVTRKPTIKPADVPLTDSDGLPIVTDRNNIRVFTKQGKPRKTGDKEKGYTLNTRPMTVEEWGEKLNEDIAARPDYYYARNEVPRLDSELEECQQEVWQIQKTIREAQLEGWWFRTVGRDTCKYCAYYDLCTSGFSPLTDPIPEGFEIVENPHPELMAEVNNG
jgi:hypothetical protein